MNPLELASRFSQSFCACLGGWKMYTRCNPKDYRTCKRCRLGRFKT